MRPAPEDQRDGAEAWTPAGAPPVLLLGGSSGALAVARELSARGFEVHLSTRAGRPELATRAAATRQPYADRDEAHRLWRELLLEGAPLGERLVVLACDDEAVEFIAEHHAALAARHVLDHTSPVHLAAFLDKALTAELVAPTGVRVPRSWASDALPAPEEAFATAGAPVIVKPVHSHRFQKEFGSGGRKHFLAHDPTELREQLARLSGVGIGALVMELIPGPDSNSTTFYAYRDGAGATLLEFSKRVLRRHPRNEGPGSLHVVTRDDEVASEARRLLDAVGFRGYANIEFKRDERDGRLVLIELNPRFTASQELLRRAGVPAATIVVEHLLGRPAGPPPVPREGVLLWDPVRDVRALRELRQAGELTLRRWLGSLRGERVHMLWSWRDPRPFAARGAVLVRRALGRRG